MIDKDTIAKRLFGKKYEELSESEKKKVDDIYIHEVSCHIAVEEGFKKIFHYCGDPKIAVKYLGTLLGFKPEYVEKILEECDKYTEVNEEICKDINELRKTLLCLTLKKVSSLEDVERTFTNVWEEIKEKCKSYGVEID